VLSTYKKKKNCFQLSGGTVNLLDRFTLLPSGPFVRCIGTHRPIVHVFSSENNDTEQPADESVLSISEQAAKHGVLCEPRLTCGLLRFCSRLHASLAIAAFDVRDRREGFWLCKGTSLRAWL
jgi:hypothetical protein